MYFVDNLRIKGNADFASSNAEVSQASEDTPRNSLTIPIES